MKKYGKYETRPEGLPAKQPKVKSTLMQTYLTSLLSLVLCVSMFFGTSYAWFTSEVNNEGNEIYIGILDVGLFKQNTSEQETALIDLSEEGEKLFDNNIRWEPGYTALETIKVVNEGDLAFKYVLNFTDGSLAEGSALSIENVAENFDVWVYDHRANAGKDGVKLNPDSYAALTAENSGWVSAGSLDELLDGKSVLDGVMVTVRNKNTETPNEGTTDGVATEDTYTIALHMKEDADSAVMGQKISLNVKLVAYQKGSEADDLGNKDYDQLVATERDLREAFENGGHITLLEDIVLTEGVSVPADKTVVLDLNGHTISQEMECTESYSMINNNGTLTITGNGNLRFVDTGAGDSGTDWASYTIRNTGMLVVENGTIEHLGQQSGNMNNAIFHYSGSTIINDGTISAPYSRSVRVWHGDMTINGGDYDGQVWVQAMSDCSLTVTGGSFKPATYGNDGSSVYVTNDTHNPTVSVSGGNFATKIGCSDATKLAGCITGGVFTGDAKNNTADILFAASFEG